MTKILIICNSPGIRRAGKEHPARELYDEGVWSEEQLKIISADPAFTVMPVDETGQTVVPLAGSAFDPAIRAEIDRQVQEKSLQLQTGFDKAVSDKVAEKMAAARAASDNTIDDLGNQLALSKASVTDLQTKLDTANTTIAALQAQIDAANAGNGKK